MDLQRLIAAWLESHAAADATTYAICALAGVAGAAIIALVQNPALPLPSKVGNKIKLGFIGSLIGGALFGIFADHSIPIGMLAGMVGPPITIFVLNEGIPSFLRSLVKGLSESKKEQSDE